MCAAMNETGFKSRREEYTEATRRALLNAAIDAFTVDGFSGASAEAIARAARVTKGAFYHHFPDKRSVFDAAVVELQRRAARRIAAAAKREAESWGRFDAGLNVYLDICAEPDFAQIVIRDGGPVLGETRFREIEDAYCSALLAASLSELVDQALIETPDVTLLARLVDAMVCELSLVLTDHPHTEQVRAIGLAAIDRLLGR
jgi:AcrR family transcriptional regulator